MRPRAWSKSGTVALLHTCTGVLRTSAAVHLPGMQLDHDRAGKQQAGLGGSG